jgi:hypothetical protein
MKTYLLRDPNAVESQFGPRLSPSFTRRSLPLSAPGAKRSLYVGLDVHNVALTWPRRDRIEFNPVFCRGLT